MNGRNRFKQWTFVLTVLTVLWGRAHAQCPAGYTGQSCNKYNYAYQKPANQMEEGKTQDAFQAVDSDISTCSHTTQTDLPWWSVDLGNNMLIEGLVISYDQETLSKLRNYMIEVQEDGETTWKTCYERTFSFPPSSTDYIGCRVPMTGRTVRFTANHNATNLILCNVGVYGSCLDGSYGNYCENECGYCNTSFPVCDKQTGRCPVGCDVGWTNSTCKAECPHGTYGKGCAFKCGHCRYNQTCIRFTGICPDICDPGWQGDMCKDPCDAGFYGLGCMECGKCRYNDCHKEFGNCTQGCAPGYKLTDSECRTPCDDGKFGQDCEGRCGMCNVNTTAPGPCNKTTGLCDFGCAPGYYQDSACLTGCPGGKWGLNCANTCGNCGSNLINSEEVVRVNCTTTDGSCLTGCMPGYQGLPCTDRCTAGTYGKDCAKTCGQCQGICDVITGECPSACLDGYLGTKCDIPCDPGSYGPQCQLRCPANCANNCSVTDGSCVCKDGWTGDKCQDVCPSNHYGKNCAYKCGNCLPGTTCNQGDGYCAQGCAQDWTGLKCDSMVIRESYERDYTGAIVGGVFGFIGLCLIILFAAWVVWRYRNDKSIHIKELAGSIRRMSVRRSQQIRRSIQRLSMRNKRPDQRKLDNDIEGPARTHHSKGRSYKRMYDCVQLQSNVIHYDDFTRLYLRLQEISPNGRPFLYETFDSFLNQRPRDHSPVENGNGHVQDNRGYYNAAAEDVQIHMDSQKSSIPAFLPLGSNLSGFLVINSQASSNNLWNHLQQRQIETIISIGKDSSFSWRPGERMTIGQEVVDCIDVQLYGSHKESKLTVQRVGVQGRRAIRHLECFFFNPREEFPNIQTLLMFMERFEQLHSTQKGRSIIVNYVNLHDQAILFTLVASMLDILKETKRVDILRTVAIGGKPTAKSIRTFDGFKYLHDVVFNYCASDNRATTI